MKQLDYKILESPSKINKKLIIFIHGYGANSNDLIALAPFFQNQNADLCAISPCAPHVNQAFPNSYYWFPLEEWNEEYLSYQLDKTIPILENFISIIKKKYNNNITEENIILCGFSQGSLLASHFALQNDNPFAAIISYSGGILPCLKNSIINDTPICLIHGKEDDVLPVEYSIDAQNLLENIDHNYECYLIDNLAHSINKEGIELALDFLKRNEE